MSISFNGVESAKLSVKLGWRTAIVIVKYCCNNATQSKEVNFNSKYRKYIFVIDVFGYLEASKGSTKI